MLTILFNQMFRFWGNNQNTPPPPRVSPEELRRNEIEQDNADVEEIIMALNCFLHANHQ